MQYNESLYNGDSYNLTNYTQTLVETITPTDADVLKSISVLRTDSQGTADALGGSASLQAFLETVTIYQRANTPFAYNNGRYNDYMYNARADEDEILLMATKALSDIVVLTDAMQPFEIAKELLESLASNDATVISDVTTLQSDVIVISTEHRIEITNKALNETLRINDWLTIKQSPQSDQWGD